MVIYFYPRDNTPGCTKEACGFRDVHRDLADRDALVLGVSKDSLESHDNFIREFDLPFVLLSDPDTKMMADYGAWGEKNMYGKKAMGCFRSTVVIDPAGRVVKHWKSVRKTAEHPAAVLDFLEQNQASSTT